MQEGGNPGMGETGPGMGRRFFVGSIYVGFGGWFNGAFRFAVNLGIARLLGPEILGLWAFVYSINDFLNMIGAFSMGLALIQSPETSREHEDTAFSIAGLLGLVGILAAAVAAPVLWIYHSPQAGLFVLLLGFSRLMLLMGNVPMAKLERGLRYEAVAVINVTAGVLPGLLALLLAWGGVGAWSLMAQDLLIALTILGLAILKSGYRPRLIVDRRIASGLMAFGRPMFASRSLEIAFQRIDRLLIGTFMGNHRLGLYHQSRLLAETGWLIGNPISRLIFNLYSRFQSDPERLSRAFSLINFFLVRVMFAGAATLVVYPDPTIRLLLGEGWAEAAPILGALGLYAAFLPIFENIKQLLYGRGMPRMSVAIRLVQLLVLSIGVGAAIALDNMRFVTIFLTGATIGGVVLASYFNRDVVRGTIVEGFLVPTGALLITSLLLGSNGAAKVLSGVPFFVLPFLPPLVFAAIVLLIENRRLFRRLETLRILLWPERGLSVGTAHGR